MRDHMKYTMNKYRITKGALASDESYHLTGAFLIPIADPLDELHWECVSIISDEGIGRKDQERTGWEHVSCTIRTRDGDTITPPWKVMCYVKDIFWRSDEVVIQYHPAQEDYVNIHSDVLHLWSPLDDELPTPPSNLVGPKP